MVGVFVKQAGAWVEVVQTPAVKVGSTWTPVKEIHAKNAGVWTKVWPSIVPPAPTNLRFGYKTYSNNSYEVQVVWDPIVANLADYYELVIHHTGQVINMGRTNFYVDRTMGPGPGFTITYSVRAIKGSTAGPYSSQLTTITPADAGFAHFIAMGVIGDYYGHVYLDVQHDGNAENKSWILFRRQQPYYEYVQVATAGLIPGAGVTTTGTDAFPQDHYRGASAGSTATANAFSDNIEWALHTVNSWNKPNAQIGSPYAVDLGNASNSILWKPSRPADGYIRLNAVASNVYRRQPTNSLGWVGGVPRCGAGGGDFLGCWLWHKPALTDKGFANRIRFGYALQIGLGRRNDGGNLNVTFNFGGTAFANGFGGDPRALIEAWTSRTWQRLQGELFTVPLAWANTYILDSQPHGGACVFATNSNDTYAEFGNVAEIMGGFVNGQFVIHSPFG